MKKYLLPITIITISIFGIVILFFSAKQIQTSKNKAAVTGGIGSITLTPLAATHYPGETFPVTVKFSTGGASISSIALRISYPYTGTTPELDIVDSSGIATNQFTPDISLTGTGDWSFPVKSVTRSGGLVTIDFAAIDTNITGFTASSPVNLTTVYFKVNRAAAANPLVLSFDTAQSKMVTKSNPTDILNTPANASYTIINDTTAPNTISNLSIASTSTSSASLTWTAPADTGPLGKASSYDLRYSLSPITTSNFASATQIPNEPVPSNLGSAEALTVTGLNQNTLYYFAIKSIDAAGNVSAISNIPSGTTLQVCVPSAPNLSLTPSTQTGKSNQQLTYQLTIQNTNTGSCGNATFTYSVNIANTGHWVVSTPSPASVTLANGVSANASITLTPDATVTNGTYPFTVNVVSAAGTSPVNANYAVLNPTTMNLKIKLQGILTKAPNNTLTIVVKDAGTTTTALTNNMAITSDTSGIFTGSSDISNLPPGSYDIYIKVPDYLNKKFAAVSLTSGIVNNQDFTSVPLLVGDFDNNNAIDIVDIGKILSAYTSLSVPVTTNNQMYDVNADGVIDVTDVALSLSNYTQLEVLGD